VEVDEGMLENLFDGFDIYNGKKLKDELMKIVYTERTLLSVKGL